MVRVVVPAAFCVRLALPASETPISADPVLVRLNEPVFVRMPAPVMVPFPRPS